jgi:hypothetical protein
MNTANCTPDQLDTLRHMLGINDPYQRVPVPYRNYAAVPHGDPEFIALAQAGLIECYRTATGPTDYDYYRCTESGRTAALSSYKTIQASKSKRVYRKYLEVSDALTGLSFRDFLVDPQFAETRKNT